jgi:hypothetical protein
MSKSWSELQAVGDEIAELAAHLDAAVSRLLALIRWNGLLPRLVRHRVPKSPCVHRFLWKEESK